MVKNNVKYLLAIMFIVFSVSVFINSCAPKKPKVDQTAIMREQQRASEEARLKAEEEGKRGIEEEKLKEEEEEIKPQIAREAETNVVPQLGDIHFDFDKSDIRTDAR